MRFPEREMEIVRLATDVSRGLAENREVFPAPPAPAEVLDEALAIYHAARDERLDAAASAREATRLKNEALETLTVLLRADVRYAESMAFRDGGKLPLLGLAPRRKAIRTEPVAPGQVQTLRVCEDGNDWVALSWSAPLEGGPVAAYSVQRRRRMGGDWTVVHAVVETSATLYKQETGVELEYRVIGISAAGEGPISNIVRVVL